MTRLRERGRSHTGHKMTSSVEPSRGAHCRQEFQRILHLLLEAVVEEEGSSRPSPTLLSNLLAPSASDRDAKSLSEKDSRSDKRLRERVLQWKGRPEKN